jgi:hypothetical protein
MTTTILLSPVKRRCFSVKFVAKAITTSNYYKLLDSHLVCGFISQFPVGTKLKVTFQEDKIKVWKSYDQLKLIHALIKLIDKEIGNNCMERTKRQVKEQIGYFTTLENPITKVMEKEGLSFGDLSKEQGTEVIEQVIALCEFLNIVIPPSADRLSLLNYIDEHY